MYEIGNAWQKITPGLLSMFPCDVSKSEPILNKVIIGKYLSRTTVLPGQIPAFSQI